MKKSKLIALILTFIFILTACGEGGGNALFSISQEANFSGNFVFEEGAIFVENPKNDSVGNALNKIKYLDFATGESTVLCSKPGCVHEDSDETCLGNLMGTPHFIAGDKYYYLALSYDEDTKLPLTALYESDLNRQNERLVENFEGTPYGSIFVHGNIGYIIMLKDMTEMHTQSTAEMPQALSVLAYDFKKMQIRGEAELINGYSVNLGKTYGVYDNNLIYSVSASSQPIDWEASEEDFENINSGIKESYVTIDINNLSREENESLSALLGIDLEMDKPLELIGDIFYYNTDGILQAYDLVKKENMIVFEGDIENALKIGEKFLYDVNFALGESYVYDSSSKESKKIYLPNNGNLGLGLYMGIWHEYGDYIYATSASFNGPIDEYEEGAPFIIKVHKDDIYKEEYEAEIVS